MRRLVFLDNTFPGELPDRKRRKLPSRVLCQVFKAGSQLPASATNHPMI